MDKLKKTQSWVIGETVIASIFVIVTVATGLSMMKLVNLTSSQQVFMGRVMMAFGLLAFFYLTFLASKQRSK